MEEAPHSKLWTSSINNSGACLKEPPCFYQIWVVYKQECIVVETSDSVSGFDVATTVVAEREYYYLCSDKPLSHTCGAHLADRYMALLYLK